MNRKALFSLFLFSKFVFEFVDAQDQSDIVHQQTQGVQTHTSVMQLFGYTQCRYCQKVLSFLQAHPEIFVNCRIELIDVSDTDNHSLLQSISGKTQVPYLVDIDAHIKMAESDDIIEYLMKKYHIAYAQPCAQKLSVSDDNMQAYYNPNTFLSDIQSADKPTMVLVSATWCRPCQIFKPIFLEVAEKYADSCHFVCVDGDANYEIVEQLNIPGYPTVIAYKNGQKIVPHNYRSVQGLTNFIEQHILGR
jgi:thioredoxin 1